MTGLELGAAIAVLAAGLALAVPAAAGAVGGPLAPDHVADRIRRHRTAEVTLTVLGMDGKPLANAEVTVRQARHKFLFGCNIFRLNPADASDAQKAYQARFADLLNYATLPFYWGGYERAEGRPDEPRLRAMAKWCADRGIHTKGHPLCWHQAFPRWALEKPLEELERLQLGRIRREVTALAGLVDRWDVVNEAVVMPDYTHEVTNIPALCRQVGRLQLLKQTFAAARAANPRAVLLLNDYDTSEKYERLIQECLDAGMPIDAIGIQSHMHQGYWGAEKTWQVCERFARFGKPLHFTELTIISGPRKPDQRWHGPPYPDWHTTPEGEVRQARDVAEFYRVLFSHPAVEAVTWWDLTDEAWLGAPAGLVRKDLSPKPAYEALMKMVKDEWWTPAATLRTDAAGRVTFRGFLGDYAVEAGGGYLQAWASVDRPGQAEVEVKLLHPPR